MPVLHVGLGFLDAALALFCRDAFLLAFSSTHLVSQPSVSQTDGHPSLADVLRELKCVEASWVFYSQHCPVVSA